MKVAQHRQKARESIQKLTKGIQSDDKLSDSEPDSPKFNPVVTKEIVKQQPKLTKSTSHTIEIKDDVPPVKHWQEYQVKSPITQKPRKVYK